MNKREFSGAGKSHAKRPRTAVSNPCFHSKIIDKNSPGKKKLFSFPFLFFRKGSGEETVRGKRHSFPVHFKFLRYFIFPESPERKAMTKNQFLQLTPLKKREVFRVYEKVSNTRDVITQNTREIIQRKETFSQKEIHTLSRNGNFYPSSGSLVSGSLTPLNTARKKVPDTVRKKVPDTVRKKTPEKSLLRSSIVTRLAENSLFHPGEKSRKPINRIYPGSEISGKSLRIPFPPGGEIRNLNRASLESVASGTILPDKNLVYWDVSALNPTPLSKLKVSLKPRFIMPSDPAFNSGFVLDSSSGKETYRQAPGLVFNSSVNLSQELEREMESIKEELAQAEKAAEENYSSIYSRMEEELKRNLEINRISEQVMQQIAMRLKIEKERRGLL